MDGVQGGSVVKVEEEEETLLRVYVCVSVERDAAEESKEREREKDRSRRCHMLTEFPSASNIKAVFIRPPCAYATAFETRIKFLTSH